MSPIMTDDSLAARVKDWDIRAAQNTIAPEVRTKNRRKRYLDLHPEYFGPQLELADPLLYDRLIRRFQTAAEREVEGRKKGYSGVLEADLYRGEAKLVALQNPDVSATLSYRRGPDGEILAEEKDEVPANKEEGYERWKWEMGLRFVRGKDEDFDYSTVDSSDQYDDHRTEDREAEEAYFDEETPSLIASNPHGETGIQDF